MRWNLDQLQQFVATVDQGSITAAARHLGRAQSAVSTAIGMLEADLGLVLFDRSKHRATLTDCGAIMLQEARELLMRATALERRARSLTAGDESKLGLALDEALPSAAVSALLREFSQRFPMLGLTLLNGTAAEVSRFIDEDRVDLAVHFDRGPIAAHFDRTYIGAVPQRIFVSCEHPLLDKPTVTAGDLASYRQLLLQADDVQETAYSPSVWRVDSFYDIAEMVADDIGWAILPVNIAKYESNPHTLKSLECSSVGLPDLQVRMLWWRGRELGQAARWVERRFGELLRSLAL